jgi:hypothetical protein
MKLLSGSWPLRAVKPLIKPLIRPSRPVTRWFEVQLRRFNAAGEDASPFPTGAHPRWVGSIETIRQSTFDYLTRLKVSSNGEFVGYRYSEGTRAPLLYCTLAVLLLKHLYGRVDESVTAELSRVLTYQGEDGLFRDPEIDCPEAATEDWWGWRHLTLHALMTLALYNVPARQEIRYLSRFSRKDEFRAYLESRDWGDRADFTSNELQNVGVMLQYARDYQGSSVASPLLELLYEVLAEKQDPETGLYGNRFDTPETLSAGVQAGYHFWCLLFYDRRPIGRIEAVIDSVLKTQNALGGYGVKWNSSACEDIDSIDPLVRLGALTEYRRDEIRASLRRALPAILQNLNRDGGWVFRRDEPLQLVHREMSSAANQSNVFYSWFRTLGLAYCLIGLGDESPETLRYDWNLTRAPGHQFPCNPESKES